MMELKSGVLNVAKNQCFDISPKLYSCMSVSFVYMSTIFICTFPPENLLE